MYTDHFCIFFVNFAVLAETAADQKSTNYDRKLYEILLYLAEINISIFVVDVAI